jgi:hypothetical protein
MHLLTWSKNLTDETTDRLDKLIDKKLTDRKNDDSCGNAISCGVFRQKKECSSLGNCEF